jgi:hypothetical protein
MGYGKTTAVYEWLKTIEQSRGWLSLDINDNDRWFSGDMCVWLWKDYARVFWRDIDNVFSSQQLLEANVHIISLSIDWPKKTEA